MLDNLSRLRQPSDKKDGKPLRNVRLAMVDEKCSENAASAGDKEMPQRYRLESSKKSEHTTTRRRQPEGAGSGVWGVWH
jgi:hypothetical protein